MWFGKGRDFYHSHGFSGVIIQGPNFICIVGYFKVNISTLIISSKQSGVNRRKKAIRGEYEKKKKQSGVNMRRKNTANLSNKQCNMQSPWQPSPWQPSLSKFMDSLTRWNMNTKGVYPNEQMEYRYQSCRVKNMVSSLFQEKNSGRKKLRRLLEFGFYIFFSVFK